MYDLIQDIELKYKYRNKYKYKKKREMRNESSRVQRPSLEEADAEYEQLCQARKAQVNTNKIQIRNTSQIQIQDKYTYNCQEGPGDKIKITSPKSPKSQQNKFCNKT